MKAYETSQLENRAVRVFPNDQVLEAYRKRYPNISIPLGIVSVHKFWEEPDQDYLKTYYPETDEVSVRWGRREFATWLGGVALTPDDQRALHLANRDHGSFEEKVGWRPLVIVSYLPSQEENDLYIMAQGATIEEEWKNFEESDDERG